MLKMKLLRREFLHLAVGVVALPAVSRVAKAQTYPTRPITIVAPFAAGGATDIVARIIGQWLSDKLRQSVLIDNRPGASGNIGTEAVVRARADGYTLLMAGGPNAINATVYEKLNFNFIRDIAPVARTAHAPLVVVVHPSIPAKTVPELIAYAKANPGKLNIGSPGNGTANHVAGEMFKTVAGVDMVQVQYRGSAPAIADLLGGQVQVMLPVMSESIEYIRAGTIRALAVTSASRSDALPDLPTLADFVPGFEAGNWWGIGAPKNTPAEIIRRLNQEINAALADPVVKARFADLGATVFPGSTAEFEKFIADETEKWGKVVKFAGIKAD